MSGCRGVQESEHRLEDRFGAGRGAGQRVRSGDASEVAEPEAEHDGASGAIGGPHSARHPVDQLGGDAVEFRVRAGRRPSAC